MNMLVHIEGEYPLTILYEIGGENVNIGHS